MTTESQDDSRWRSEAYFRGHYDDTIQLPQPPAPAAVDRTAANTQGAIEPHDRAWDGRPSAEVDHSNEARGASSTIDHSNDGSTYHSRTYERYGPSRRSSIISSLTNSPPRQSFTGPWQSLPLDQRTQHRHVTATPPLTLHIPKLQELPKISTTYSTSSSNVLAKHTFSANQSGHSQLTTSLPSFATLQEHAGRTDDGEDVDMAPMSSLMSCYQCMKLMPMIQEVAGAIAELDQNVQSYCNKAITRTQDLSKDSPPVRALQWILDTIKKAKGDLQHAGTQSQPNYYYPGSSSAYPEIQPRNDSPPNTLKRSADRWDQEALPPPKRPRSGPSIDEIHRTASEFTTKYDRRASIDFIGRSPLRTESIPGSAFPRIGSPGHMNRPLASLPSPSSLVYPPSAAPSFVGPTGQSVGSPAPSYQPSVSVHSASTNSATSAHFADLQHQVTLKSLALQTLQSEYASLLQKLQREKVKSQTIEKKTSVADQEINDLTNKNEDLTEQVKSLEVQLEECEKKREAERAEAAKEKTQWLRMLEMGGRLHSKNAEEKQKLKDETKYLSQRLTVHGTEGSFRANQVQGVANSQLAHSSHIDSDVRPSNGSILGLEPRTTAMSTALGGRLSNNVEDLKSEIVQLNEKIETLRSALMDMRRHNQDLDERAQSIVRHNGHMRNIIGRALQGEALVADHKREEIGPNGLGSGHSSPSRQKPLWSSDHYSTEGSGVVRPASHSPNVREEPMVTHGASSASLTSTTASIVRRLSPSATEPEFHVVPTTSFPEELIRAPGPVPPPMSAAPYTAKAFEPSADSSGRDDIHEKQQRPKQWHGPELNSTPESSDKMQTGSFRPLAPQVSSPYATIAPAVEKAGYSPNSYGGSPGPSRGSSVSSGSGQLDRKSSSGSMTEAASAMPPPPRPAILQATVEKGFVKP